MLLTNILNILINVEILGDQRCVLCNSDYDLCCLFYTFTKYMYYIASKLLMYEKLVAGDVEMI